MKEARVARAQKRKWIDLVAGLLVGAATQPLALLAGPDSRTVSPAPEERVLAQASGGSTRTRAALNAALDAERSGDLDKADALYREATARANELSPDERRQLQERAAANRLALQARTQAREQIGLAESALQHGKIADAAVLVKKITANEVYLSPADKQRFQSLRQRLPLPGHPSPSGGLQSAASAHAKLQQARAELARADLDAAEALLLEVEQLQLTFAPQEDSPRKVRDDLGKLRHDPKSLLAAARTALQRGRFDRAEQYARAADKLASPFTFMMGDTPAKVMKEVQTARQNAPAGEKSAEVSSPYSSNTLAPTSASADKARALVRQGRQALARNDAAQARKCADEANALKAELHWSEDNPARLLEDIARTAPAVSTVAAKEEAAKTVAPIKTKEEALTLLQQGRERLAKGQVEEASHIAARLRAAHNIHWGLFFEDTPDKFQADVNTARLKHDKEESVQLLAEGRRLFDKKDYDGAKKMAFKAQTKHGQYSIWDHFGDRPNKLLADIEAARQKEHIVKLPDPPKTTQDVADLSHGPLAQPGNDALAQKQTPQGNGAATPPNNGGVSTASYNAKPAGNAVEARQILQDARLALKNGALTQARFMADRVRDMNVAFGPNEDSPEKIYRDIEAKSPPSSTAVAANKPSTPTPYPPSPSKEAVSPPKPKPTPVPAVQVAEKSKNRVDPLTAPTRARQLVAEASALQKQNRLIEARDKIDEARRLGVAFRPDEESPNQVYQRLGYMARQRIDMLVNHAGETLRYGTQAAATRCQDAERDLAQAGQLASAFGLDMQPIEMTRRLVNQLRTKGDAVLVSNPSSVPGSLPPSNIERGGAAPSRPAPMQLLDQARMELRSGQTATARHLAEEAIKLGAGETGLAVLRSIDAEDDAQTRLKANRTFDEVLQAYRLRDYRRANLMLAGIDNQKLDDRRKARLREMLNTPEMQPSANASGLTLASARQPGMPAQESANAGHARATDDAGQELLTRTRALREVKFQQLRSEGLDVQSKALERFRAGQSDVAVDMLEEYLAHLADEQLDPAQMALLRRPIDSRVQQFRLLKQQTELVNNRFDDKSRRVQKEVLSAKNAEQVKQKNIASLMKQYNELFGRAKYAEAELVALKVKELDPDNPFAVSAITMAKFHRHHDEYESDKADKDEAFLRTMHDLDKINPDAISNDITFTKDQARRETIRNRKSLEGYSLSHKTTAEQIIERKLTEPSLLSYVNVPLGDVIKDIRGEHGLNIYVDDRALADKNITLDVPVTIQLDNIRLESGLKLLLNTVHLTYVITDDVLKITTEDQARGKLQQKVYQVTDLVIPIDDFGQKMSAVEQLGITNVNQSLMQPAPMTQMTGMQGGQSVGMPSGSLANANGSFAADPSSGGVQVVKNHAHTQEETLIKLITSTISPHSWIDQGGPGTIDFHPLTNALVINQTPDIQQQVQDLLNALRRLIDQEVAVEVKFISIAEDFFERIGVNFNMNILNNSRQALQYQPQLTSGQFAQPGYINSFNPGGLISGMTPAGTLTSDLNIPIINTTYPQAVPPFGGYPGVPGYGGLTLGLAFLSDIQVFLFMEAVQGDVRSNVMQAPKLTLFNGQTATLSVTDFQFFTIGVSIANGGFGQLVYNPVTSLFRLGPTLFIQAVISGDRRFVRLSLQPNLTNLVNGEVNLFPVVTPIFPLFDGTATGQPVVFTQFIQQPRITSVFVQTTVAVPDGGTVLMGGLKRMSEGRNEYGPPVISKIPYLSRLFRNIGYGRSAESLLIMVTPRIIIQAEEEEKQTGYTLPPAVTGL
jgi:type II secretory pathway component GspD/PulD (secretin)